MSTRLDSATVAVSAAAPPTVVVVGPLPPPYHGGTVATSMVLQSELARTFRVRHVDTSDRRGLTNIGRLDAGNVWLALRHALALLRALLLYRPQLVYIPLAQNTLAVLRDMLFIYPALLLRRRVLLHLHGGDFDRFYASAPAIIRLLVRRALARVERVIVLTQPLRNALSAFLPAERITVLLNGIAPVLPTVPDRARRAGPVRVLFLGNITAAKGIHELLQAVRLLHERGCAVQMDVAGGYTSIADQRAAEAAASALPDAIRLHGVVAGERKQLLLEAADIFVFPSHSEGHPYVVLEAMSAGLPVVATELPGIAATVVHDQTGRLVPVGDAAALADALADLVHDAALRDRMGRAGRQRYEQHFSATRWSTQLHAVMRDAAGAA